MYQHEFSSEGVRAASADKYSGWYSLFHLTFSCLGAWNGTDQEVFCEAAEISWPI